MLEALKDKVFHANLELVKHGLVIFHMGNGIGHWTANLVW